MAGLLHADVAARVRSIIDAGTTVAVVTDPGPESPTESIIVDFEPSTFTMSHKMRAGTGAIATEIVLRVGIETHGMGSTAPTVQARWFAIASEVIDALRADRSLAAGGTIAGVLGVSGDGEVRGPSTAALPDGSGWACLGDVIVRVRTDVC